MSENIYDALECEKIGACAGIKLHKVDLDKDYTGWVMSEKHDGVSGIYALGKFFSLSGLPLSNTQDLEDYLEFVSRDSVIFGEIISPDLTLEQLSGALNPNTKKELFDLDLEFIAFDQVTLREYISGYSTRAYAARLNKIDSFVDTVSFEPIKCMADMDAYFQWVIGGGGEGIVVRDPHAQWCRGRRARNVLKWVREYRVDLKVLDIVSGKGKRTDTVGKVILEFNNERIQADLGKGFNDAHRREVWERRHSYIGMIADVKCLSISSTGNSLRLPKIEAFRYADGVAEEDKDNE